MMRALTAEPGVKGSAKVEDVPEPPEGDGALVVETAAIGVCGTDREILAGEYGWAPPGKRRLVIGHESVGRILEAPPGSGFQRGDWVVGIVRRPDPVPCASCAVDEWDMCRNGQYTERGIKERDGYASQRYRIEPKYCVKLDPSLGPLGVLLEPASVLAKAWDHTERIGHRAHWQPRTCLVTGAGPIGLFAALMGVQRGLEVHVLDREATGPKPELVRALGAAYHTGSVKDLGRAWDVVIECTGAPALFFDAIESAGPGGIVCLTGVSPQGRQIPVDAGGLNREIVLENGAIFGSVNANRRHYELAAEALAKADRAWLERLITRPVPLERFNEALERRPGDVKTVLEIR